MNGKPLDFAAWSERHRRLHKTAPPLESEADLVTWEALRKDLDRIGITTAEANEVTDALLLESPSERTHTRALIRLARRRKGNPSTAEAPPVDLKAAATASAGCPECSGSGLTTRRMPHPWYPKGLPTSFYCHFCDAGLAMQQQHRRSPEFAGRILDLRARPELWDRHPNDPPPDLAEDAAF